MSCKVNEAPRSLVKAATIPLDKGLISAIKINKGGFNIPLALAIKYNFKTPLLSFYPNRPFPEFNGVLRENQTKIKEQALQKLLDEHTLILSCFTGFGKTITAISLACELKVRTLVVVTRIILMDQWKASILKVTKDSTVEILTSINKDEFVLCDFAIVNIQTIPKFEELFLQSFGMVIVDEVHLVLSAKAFKGLLHLTPRYLLGLSATSYRKDELNALFPLFFGNNHIKLDLFKHHVVYKVYTKFKPLVKRNVQGKVDWNCILDSQASDEARNNLIVDIIKTHPERTFLVLVKRIKQGVWLYEKLKDCLKVSTLFGNNHKYDKECKVLIGTNSKIGTGFDFDKLDTLVLGADVVDYYIQFLGRIMRREDMVPWIFDLIDDNAILNKHFMERKKIYLKHGGVLTRCTIGSD